MMTEFSICTEDGKEARVVYTVVEDEANEIGMRYGITAVMEIDGKKTDEYRTKQSFFTYTEAERMSEAMCRHNVMPCTLVDIMRDLSLNY